MDTIRRFKEAIEQHRDRVYTLAYYHLGHSQEAEDVTQEALVRLWEHWEEIGARESARPWLIRVTRNLCMDRHRWARRTQDALVSLDDPETAEEIQTDSPGPAGAYEAMETQARLESAIQQLEEPHRSVVILREIEELSYKEIAEVLDLSIDQVKVTLHRARKKLREELMERVAQNEA